MEKEMDQKLEWLKAQKIEISVDLLAAAKKQLRFLEAVDRNRWLYDGPLLERAIYRYNVYWLPLLAKHIDSSSLYEGSLVPPLDCEWIWHCHRLNPVRYKFDCEKFYGRVLDNSGIVSSTDGSCKLQTERLWKRLYPMEPYDIDLAKTVLEPVDTSALEKCTTYDLVSAVKRQSPFYYQVSRSYVDNAIFLQEAIERYKAFLYLIKKNKEKSIKLFCVPTYDIDLIWHTHQLHALSYCKDLKKMLGKILEHDDTDSDRSKGKKLDTGFTGTTSQWEETFGKRYWKAGAMSRGDTPKVLVTTSPYVSPGDKLNSKEEELQNVIQVPDVRVLEVILEILDVKNLQECDKGKVFVVFKKSQFDSLFKTERRVSISSESSGEKQVALFHCEAKGDLSFNLMSCESKSLGFGSLSISEFLNPVTTLSIDKWVKLEPVKREKTDDSNRVSLRVSITFTPPVQSPYVLHLFHQERDSCFFPNLGKIHLDKRFTSVVDVTETELISLQMRNSKDKRQVIGVKECGETYVLAEYDGSLWSLFDSKWSLEKTRDDSDSMFEVSGTRMMRVYSGRKLEYETKHYTKVRREEDFMTLVEFSKKHPYGKAVGLLDLKLGSFEVNEKWLVLPGIVCAFILNEAYGTTEESKESEILSGEEVMMVNEKVYDGARCLPSAARCRSNVVNARGACGSEYGGTCVDMVVEEGAHCGGHCGGGQCGGGRCGGRCCGGGCSSMTTEMGLPCGGGGCKSSDQCDGSYCNQVHV